MRCGVGFGLVKWPIGSLLRKWLKMRGKFSEPRVHGVSMKSGKLEAFIRKSF